MLIIERIKCLHLDKRRSRKHRDDLTNSVRNERNCVNFDLMKKIGYILPIILLFASCYKIESYPPEPSIEYVSFEMVDSIDLLDNPVFAGELRFSFIDGDGDVGDDAPSDTSLNDSIKHVFIDLYKKEDGIFVKQELQVDYSYRIPYFEGGTNNPVIKGDVVISELNFYPPFDGDTLRFNFRMRDRAGNYSNIEESDVFVPADSI